MIRKSVILAGAGLALTTASPAHATWDWWNWGGWTGSHTHNPTCGHTSTSSTSTTSTTSTSTGSTTGGTTNGGSTTTGGGTTTGGSTTTGGTTSGTQVPEPGMFGMFGLSLAAVAYSRRRRKQAA